MRDNLSIAMAVVLSSILVISGCATPPGPNVEEQAPDIPESTEVGSEAGPEIGKLAPDFTLETIDGQSVTLSDFRGKMVMLVFWVMECKECIRELSHIQAFFDEEISDSLVVLTVNVGNAMTEVEEFIDTNKYTFPVLLDLDAEVCIKYQHGAPTTFFIDANGIIREVKDETFQSRDEIESILQSLGVD
ncbi:MAG: TlpA family protein disulfide reductase [Chloroflexi bacterium]|nr:TlpA family protein disulfide reductase [Chloroflexota bacterium]MBM4450255.1 TlpA family protein disulfide reductase [Chloroflexota bacterium]